jgi:hypothetical protein
MTIHSRIRYCRVFETSTSPYVTRWMKLRAGYHLWLLVVGLHIDMNGGAA